MRQNNNTNRQGIISMEEYLRKRKMIRQEKETREKSATSKMVPGAVLELAEMYL